MVFTVRRVSKKISSDMNQMDQKIKCLLTSARVFAFSKSKRSKIVRAEAKLE